MALSSNIPTESQQQAAWGCLRQHRSYLSDHVRNSAFEKAIRAHIFPGAKVLDVGSGTGILALMSLAAGADEVVAVEWSELGTLILETARRNGLDHRLMVLCQDARDVRLSVAPDIITHELIGGMLWDENLLGIIQHLSRNVAGDHTCFVPAGLTFYVAPTKSCTTELDEFWRRPHSGFDFSALIPYQWEQARPSSPTVVHQRTEEDFLASPVPLWAFDASNPTPLPKVLEVTFCIDLGGMLDGYIGFYRIDFGSGVFIETRPSAPATSWGQIAVPLHKPTQVCHGDHVTLTITPHRWSTMWRPTTRITSST